MGGKSGGGQQSTTSTSQSLPPYFLMPYIKEFLPFINYLTTGQYGPSKTPTASKYPGPDQQVAGFNQDEMAGLQGLRSSAGAQAGLAGQGAMTAENILQGNMLNPATNPQLTAYYNAAAQPMTNQYNAATAPSAMSQAALSGAFGGSADAENRALGAYNFGNNQQQLAASIYEPAYQQGLQQMTQTLGLDPSLTANLNVPGETMLSAGGIQQQQSQADLNAQYQNQYNSAMWPYEMAQALGGSFGEAGMGYGRQTGTSTMSGGGGSGKGGKMGGALGAAGLTDMMFPRFLSSIGSGISGGLGNLGSILGLLGQAAPLAA